MDIFLMGSAGSSNWRETFKAACQTAGLNCFDPVVPVWDAEAQAREIAALEKAKVVVMAITQDTASVGSLAESGWVALSALQRGQAFGLFIDPDVDQPEKRPLNGLLAVLWGNRSNVDTLEEASKRSRQLVIGHANLLDQRIPALDLYVAPSLDALREWMIMKAREKALK
jgi:Nucleoside 2-deoxyribosyltransferase like